MLTRPFGRKGRPAEGREREAQRILKRKGHIRESSANKEKERIEKENTQTIKYRFKKVLGGARVKMRSRIEKHHPSSHY